MIAEGIAKFHSNRHEIGQSTAVIVLAEAIQDEEGMTGMTEEEAETTEEGEGMKKKGCTQQLVTNVEMIANYHSNHLATSQFSVLIVSLRKKSQREAEQTIKLISMPLILSLTS